MAVGGTMGYVKGKSVPSLVAGLTFAGLYTYSGYLIKNNADYGVEFATGTSVLLLLPGEGGWSLKVWEKKKNEKFLSPSYTVSTSPWAITTATAGTRPTRLQRRRFCGRCLDRIPAV
ncbi:hypothetical protein DFJ73DRAFT_581683 [Zopfochytrium polystomum]|nr:hypothetical protein DFJ73DRAFT_581683 [Zopfochytrium polystomum]